MGTTLDKDVRNFSELRSKISGTLAGKPPRERIMVAACELFYRFGIHQVGVEAIAETAGTNKMTLYRNFRSKDELIVAYVAKLARENVENLDRLFSDGPGTPEQKLSAWVDYVENVLSNTRERGCALANAAVELDARHPARATIEAYKQQKHDRLVAAFKAAHFQDPVRLADEVFLLFEGARINLQCSGTGPASRLVSMLRGLIDASPRIDPN